MKVEVKLRLVHFEVVKRVSTNASFCFVRQFDTRLSVGFDEVCSYLWVTVLPLNKDSIESGGFNIIFVDQRSAQFLVGLGVFDNNSVKVALLNCVLKHY
jgi:hypothetical protein